MGKVSINPWFRGKIVTVKFLLIFILGCGVLLGAIVLNVVAAQFSLTSWYEFVKKPSGTSLVSYIWLFLIYPLGLGLVAYFLMKALHFLNN